MLTLHLAALALAGGPSGLPVHSTAPVAPLPSRAARTFDAKEDLLAALADATADYATGLGELAKWCHGEQAFRERNAAFASLLHYEPDHKEARRLLRYRFDRKADEWVRRSGFREPKESPASVREAYGERRAALDAKVVSATLDALDEFDRFGDVLGPEETYARLRNLQGVALDQPSLMRRLGYVERVTEEEGTAWVTDKSIETPERRAAISKLLGEARAQSEEREGEALDDVDSSVDISWKHSLRTGRIRVIARAGKEETHGVLAAAATATAFLRRLVGEPAKTTQDWTLYLLTGRSDMNRFVASYRDLDEDKKRRARQLGSMWLPGKIRCGIWGPDEATRIDMAAKQVAVRYVDTQFGVGPKRGWLVDSLGLYVNQHVVGTRISRHVTITDYVKPGEVPLTQGLEDPDADWLAIAHRCLGAFSDAEFARALGRNTNEMTAEDVVIGYALVAYLCEGVDPKSLARVLQEVGSDESSSLAALERELKLPLPEIKRRLHDWLSDVTDVTPAPE